MIFSKARSHSPAKLEPESISSRELELAIERQELQLHYQPQVDAQRGALIGFESLLRWPSPVLGNISPDVFIPLAESSGLINALWDYILGCIQQDRETLLRHPELHVAINLSALQLPQLGLADQMAKWLQKSGLDGSQVHIEITESSLLASSEITEENLMGMRSLGVAIWLDDFGTGFSSLRLMRDLPISGLKIDKSFVTSIEDDVDDFRIVSAIVAMANSLGLRVVAEGVETESQAQILGQLGCNILQGYLIGKAEPMQTLEDRWFRNEPPRILD